MNTATFAAAATTRFPFTLPAALLSVLQRSMPAPAARRLEAKATLWVARPLGRTVTCETGTLWLTFDNEPQDVVLEAGQSHRCDKASKLAIHALVAARLTVV